MNFEDPFDGFEEPFQFFVFLSFSTGMFALEIFDALLDVHKSILHVETLLTKFNNLDENILSMQFFILEEHFRQNCVQI